MKKTSKKLTIFYDAWCPLCVKTKSNIKKLDWFNNIEFTSIRSETVINIDIPINQLETSMHAIINKNNKIVSGIDAFTEITLRIPLLLIFWPLLKVSSIIGIGHKIYAFIAKNRIIIPVGKCTEESCRIK